MNQPHEDEDNEQKQYFLILKNWVNLYKNQHHEASREYEDGLYKLMQDNTDFDALDFLTWFSKEKGLDFEGTEEDYNKKQEDYDIVLAAFNLGTKKYRREQYIKKHEKLFNLVYKKVNQIDKSKNKGKETFSIHLYALYKDIIAESRGDFKNALAQNEKAVKNTKEVLGEYNYGFLHSNCRMIADAFDKKFLKLPADREYLEKALGEIEDVISLGEKFSKSRMTKARLLMLNGEYEKAKYYIKEGIKLLDPSFYMFQYKLIEYTSILDKIKLSEKFKEFYDIGKKIDELQKENENSQKKVFEIGALAVAIIVFFMQMTNSLARLTDPKTIALLLVLLVGLLILSQSFVLLISREKNNHKSLYGMLFGFILSIFGFYLIFKL